MTPRAYSSPLRAQQKAETQARILQAVVRVVLDEGVHAFTVQNVAKRAGVAHRTVYRHYETREALLEGLADLIEDAEPFDMYAALETADSLEQAIRRTYRSYDSQPETTKAVVLTSLAMRHALPTRVRRAVDMRAALAARFHHIPAGLLTQGAHLLHNMAGSRQWFLLTEERGMSTAEAEQASVWLARLLHDDLDRRDRAASTQEKA